MCVLHSSSTDAPPTSADGGDCSKGVEEWPVVMEQSCDTLFQCFVTTIKEGLRAGGGISDVLRRPSSQVRGSRYLFHRQKISGLWWKGRGQGRY